VLDPALDLAADKDHNRHQSIGKGLRDQRIGDSPDPYWLFPIPDDYSLIPDDYAGSGATKMKPKIQIPGIAIIAIIIVFIVLGAKGVRYVLSNSPENQPLKTSQKATPEERVNSRTFSSLSGMQSSGMGDFPHKSFSDYQVIIENDLLRPLGWQKTIAAPSSPEPVVQRQMPRERPAPTNDLILTGIVHLGEESIALIEDISKGEAYFLREGDKLKDHVVEAIGEESITLVNENSKLTPTLGSMAHYGSSGQILMSELTDRQTTRNVAKNTGEKAASSGESSANLSLIERMKARRREELGQE
jgi:hypothetical protein